jgi:hypothetical protein
MKKSGKKVVSAHIVPDSFIGSIKGAKYWKPLGRALVKYSGAILYVSHDNYFREKLGGKVV